MTTNIPRENPDATQVLPDFYPAVRVATAKDEPPRYTRISSAQGYRFWQPNDHNTLCVLVVDIDSNNWVLPMWNIIANNLGLMPSWIIEKRGNGHGQLGWIIERVSTGENARNQPIRYAHAVRHALTKAFDGDENFSNARCWNPTWDGWTEESAGEVTWGIVEPRSLGALREALQQAGLWVTAKHNRRPVRTPDAANAPGRNCHVFDAARLRARGNVADAAHAANDALSVPLSTTEVNGIIRSIERWEATHGAPWERKGSLRNMTEEERELQRERGRRGGLVNSQKQQQARAKGPAAASVTRSAEAVGRAATARAYKDKGFSNKEIAKKMNTSLSSVHRWLRQTRESAGQTVEKQFEFSL